MMMYSQASWLKKCCGNVASLNSFYVSLLSIGGEVLRYYGDAGEMKE